MLLKAPPEKLGSFYFGAQYDLKKSEITENLVNYNRFNMIYDKELLLNWNEVVNDDVVHGYNP